jgi:hypothetical protein
MKPINYNGKNFSIGAPFIGTNMKNNHTKTLAAMFTVVRWAADPYFVIETPPIFIR